MLKSHPERLRKMPVHGVVFLPESIPHAASRLLIGFNAVVSCSRSKKKSSSFYRRCRRGRIMTKKCLPVSIYLIDSLHLSYSDILNLHLVMCVSAKR